MQQLDLNLSTKETRKHEFLAQMERVVHLDALDKYKLADHDQILATVYALLKHKGLLHDKATSFL